MATLASAGILFACAPKQDARNGPKSCIIDLLPCARLDVAQTKQVVDGGMAMQSAQV